ncbi:progonadoliberin-2 [Vulpes vulpes]|uniref:Progonadoliberin-2 n=1 Tax=Vulpes vulpes TaxID=9627 RepID=A0A3Q7TEH6_VULVU|nr:progonadoliberin-2 [Vulpes vulpes]
MERVMDGSACRLECCYPGPAALLAMTSCRLGLPPLLLLLLTIHFGPSKAQHWSHGWYPGGKRGSSSAQPPPHAPQVGRVLGTAANSPDQTAHNLPSNALAPPENSVPWEGRTTGWWPLCRKQHLVQTLLVSTGRGLALASRGHCG